MDAKNSFVTDFILHMQTLFRDLLIDYSARGDSEFESLVGALRYHEVTVFHTEIPREVRTICIDFNDESSRRVAHNELRRAPAPSHRRLDFVIDKAKVTVDLQGLSELLALKWCENLLKDFPEQVGPTDFHLSRTHIARDMNGMTRGEAESWLMHMDGAALRHCLFSMLRPHVTAYGVARKLRREFYHRGIEATDAWKDFERNLQAIVERAHKRVDEAIARLHARSG